MISCHVKGSRFFAKTHEELIRKIDEQASNAKRSNDLDAFYAFDQTSEFLRKVHNDEIGQMGSVGRSASKNNVERKPYNKRYGRYPAKKRNFSTGQDQTFESTQTTS